MIAKSRLTLFANNYNNLFHCQISYILDNSLSWFLLLTTDEVCCCCCRCFCYSARCNKKVLCLLWQTHIQSFVNENNDLCYCLVCRKSTEFEIVVKTVLPKCYFGQKLCYFGQKFWTENMVSCYSVFFFISVSFFKGSNFYSTYL